jgi:hypothetical protein
MQCSQYLPGAVWSIHQYQFSHDLKVLSLSQYDLILGMDWLQQFSPMKVDWSQRWLLIPYKGASVKLQGIIPDDQDSPVDLLVQIVSTSDAQEEAQLHPAITALLNEFPSVTSPPDCLPPKRDCDHEIPLVEGTRSVSVRPYRYPPDFKG